jgi:hypothetical protein
MRLVALDAATGRARQRAFCRPSCRPRRGAVRNAHFMRVFCICERKGWDSNPRGACAPGGFQDRCLKPLGHPSLLMHQ